NARARFKIRAFGVCKHMPNRVIVTEKHFDPKHTQEFYRLFLICQGYEVGDKVEFFGFRRWIDEIVKEYKKVNNLGEFSSVCSLGKEKYVNYIRNYVQKQEIPGQVDIFDILGG